VITFHSPLPPHPSYPNLKASYRHLLRTTRNASLSLRGDMTYPFPLLTPQKTSGVPSSPSLPPPIRPRPRSMFSHISTLYDIPGQAHIQVTSPPSSCFLFSDRDIREAIWVMNNSKATDEEGFQAEFFKHGLRALVSHLVDLFNHVVRTVFLRLGHTTSFTRYTNRAPTRIPTITGRSWWAIHSRSSMLRLSIGSSLVSWSVDTSELGDRQDSDPLIRPLITSLPSGPSLRRHDIGLRKSIVAL
jgi:hypothetical protein